MKIKAIANLRFSNKDVLKIGEIMELSDSDAVDLIERELAEPVIEVKKKKNNPDLTKNETNKNTVSGSEAKTSAENANLTNTTKEKDSSKSKPSNEKIENTDENAGVTLLPKIKEE